jgi:hypothetical protein
MTSSGSITGKSEVSLQYPAGGRGAKKFVQHEKWVPLDKDEGFVKAQKCCAVREHRFSFQREAPLFFPEREVEDQSSGRFTLHHHFRGASKRPTNHRYGHQQQAMMFLCEHPA